MLLAPPRASTHRFFRNVDIDPGLHDGLVGEMQSLRGSVYLDDGAIGREELSSAGRHQTPEDEKSWHLLMLSREQRVSACVWYFEHQNTTPLSRLRARILPAGEPRRVARIVFERRSSRSLPGPDATVYDTRRSEGGR